MNKELKPFSTHAFILPMSWDYSKDGFKEGSKREHIDFESRTKLGDFMACLINSSSLWQRKFFQINEESEHYNEFNYFHSYAVKSIFDLQQSDEASKNKLGENKVLLYFEIDTNPDTDWYWIKTLVNKEGYKLHLDGISLHVYFTGVAILTFNLSNHEYPYREDILQINEYGRRIYPEFVTDDTDCIKQVKETFLADSIHIHIEGKDTFEEDFKGYTDLSRIEVFTHDGKEYQENMLITVPKFVRGLFPTIFAFNKKEEHERPIRLKSMRDDRMFFQCWYGSDDEAGRLSEKGNIYLDDSFWYSFIYGDKKNPTIANREMMKAHLDRVTYQRWAEYGTLFGLTRDSFVAISSSVPTLLKNHAPSLRSHMKSMYYQMAVLCLAQSSSIIRFSGELNELRNIAMVDSDELVKNTQELYKNYAEFTNKLSHRRISPYIQGIELYEQFRSVMDIESDANELKEKINELFEYLKLEEAQKLSIVAAIFLPATFLVSVFALISSYLIVNGQLSVDCERWLAISLFLVFVSIVFMLHRQIYRWLFRCFYNDKQNK